MSRNIIYDIVKAVADKENVPAAEVDFHLEDYISGDDIQKLVNHNNTSWSLRFQTDVYSIEIDELNRVTVMRNQKSLNKKNGPPN